MALDGYLQITQILLNDKSFEVFNESDLTSFVNIARGQIAGESECIRVNATLSVDDASQQYSFDSINLGTMTTSVLGTLNARQISYAIGSGQRVIHTRPFPYFNQYILGQTVPPAGAPSVWSQQGQGANGTIWINLLDGPYSLTLDVVGYPVPLVDNSTAEAIAYQWTDCVPWFSAYYAATVIGDKDRAEKFYNGYSNFMARARAAATPGVLPMSFAQPQDPFAQNRLGLAQRGAQS